MCVKAIGIEVLSPAQLVRQFISHATYLGLKVEVCCEESMINEHPFPMTGNFAGGLQMGTTRLVGNGDNYCSDDG